MRKMLFASTLKAAKHTLAVLANLIGKINFQNLPVSHASSRIVLSANSDSSSHPLEIQQQP